MDLNALRGVQIVRGLEALGIPLAALPAAQELLAGFARNARLRVEMAQFLEFVAQIEARGGDPLVVLRAALATPVLGFFSNLIQPQPTLRDALEAVARLAALEGEGRRLEIEEAGKRSWVVYDNGSRDDPERAVTYELAIALLLLELRPLCAKPLPILEIWFPHAPRGRVDEYERLLEAPVRFRQVRCAFAIPSAALGWRTRRADPELARLLEVEGQRRLTNAYPSRFASKVERTLRQKLEPSGSSAHAAGLN
ncbi:MAG: AraC family transcriptional regulator ligand-binding domain-containing protein [Myxococcota bacterium]